MTIADMQWLWADVCFYKHICVTFMWCDFRFEEMIRRITMDDRNIQF